MLLHGTAYLKKTEFRTYAHMQSRPGHATESSLLKMQISIFYPNDPRMMCTCAQVCLFMRSFQKPIGEFGITHYININL